MRVLAIRAQVLDWLGAVSLLPLCLGLASCDEPSVSAPYRAQVLTHSEIDTSTGVPKYELATRELSSLTNLELLEGPHIRMFRGGSLVIREVAGSIIMGGSFVDSEAPNLRYEVEDDVVIAKDYSTLLMLSAYEVFEEITASLESLVGLSISELAEGNPRLDVHFEPTIRLEGEVDAELSGKFNAFYMPGAKKFGLAQRSSLEKMPLAASPTVLSHEFGHRLFDRAFFGDTDDECFPAAGNVSQTFQGRLSLEFAISGLNEGYGDFLSFVFTGSTNPLGEYEFIGDRNFRDTDFVFSNYQLSCSQSFYCIGTLFTRSLYQSMSSLGLDPTVRADREILSRQVFTALMQTKSQIEASPERLPDAPAALRSCGRVGASSQHDGQVLSAFFAAFVPALPSATRTALCSTLADNFGDTGFSVEARSQCQ